jgi:NDP-sugar pyrophosphorylase family protein
LDEFDYPVVIATIGGEGTRLYPLTLLQPKALVPLVNYPIFTRMLEVLARQGIKKFVFASNGIRNTLHLKDVFRYGGGFSKKLSLPMEYYNIKDDVMVISGDNIIDVKIQEIISFHREKDAIATVVLKEISPDTDISPFGVAKVNDDNRIVDFVEKPTSEKASSRFINTGIYLFSPRILDVLKEMGDMARDIGGNLIPFLLNKGYPVYGLKYFGYWADVGTPDNFLKTSLDILAQRVENIRFREEHKGSEGVWIHSTTSKMFKAKGPDVKKNTFIGGDCFIDPTVTIENSSIGDNCIIKGNTYIKDSVVMDFVNIGESVTLKGCIVGRYATLEDNCLIDSTSTVEVAGKKDKTPVVGDGVHIVNGSFLGPCHRVAPVSRAHHILTSGRFVDLGYDNKNFYFAEK